MARPADPNAKSALVAAARAEFLKHGIVKARVEDITAACGLSKGAFYLHYPSKEALFHELVARLEADVLKLIEARHAAQRELVGGTAKRGKKAKAPPLDLKALVTMNELERRYDRQMLELLWEARDVVGVALHGAQGTPFEGVLWRVVDNEASRVEGMIDQLKAAGVCRPDIPAEVVSAMVIGTWILLIRRMATLSTPPDFDYWVEAIQSLLADGTTARAASGRRR
jgi:AcrR family transcriptional regulator